MNELLTTTAGLWLAVVLSGLYHGLNPGMGWPLAVSSALMERRQSSLFRALLALSAGHFAAMLVVLLPFSAMTTLATYERPLRLGAGVIVIGLGAYLLLTRRHPRFLARVPPNRLALWSFLVAIVHGAALMLAVAAVHTGAMLASGGLLAWGVYRWIGLRFLSTGWFDLEALWAVSLILVGCLGVWSAL